MSNEKIPKDKNMIDRGVDDSIVGKGNQIKGKLKDAAGGLTGDMGLQAEGKVDQIKGKVQDTVGKAERAFGRQTDD